MLIQMVRSYARTRSATMAYFCIVLSGFFALPGCVGPLNQRPIYEAKGIQVGIEADHTVDLRATPPVLNSHPAKITTEEIQTLLGSLEVSGWTGIIVGIFETRNPSRYLEVLRLRTWRNSLRKRSVRPPPRIVSISPCRTRRPAMRRIAPPEACLSETGIFISFLGITTGSKKLIPEEGNSGILAIQRA